MTALHPNQHDNHAARRQRWACDHAVLTISGRQMGLIVAADLNGLVITLR